MPDPWLLVAPGSLAPGEVTLDPGEARHLRAVLRRAAGASVVLTDGRGSRARGVVCAVKRNHAVVAVEEVERVPEPEGPGITVALGVLQGQAMDRAVTRAVELGVERFVPVVAARSQGGPGAAARRLAHWGRAARQALKQCHRVWEMELSGPVTLEELLEENAGAPGVVADPEGLPLDRLGEGRGRLFLVGPEGGFTREERERIARAGWVPLVLGANVLRAETALVAGVAVLTLAHTGG